MKTLLLIGLVALTMLVSACDVDLLEEDHDHNGDGVQDHAAEDHDDHEEGDDHDGEDHDDEAPGMG